MRCDDAPCMRKSCTDVVPGLNDAIFILLYHPLDGAGSKRGGTIEVSLWARAFRDETFYDDSKSILVV